MAIETDVHVWDTATLREAVRPLRYPRGEVWRTCFSPDGCLIATVSDNFPGYRICVWDISGGRPEAWQVDEHADLDHGPDMRFSADSRVLAVIEGTYNQEKQVRLWDVPNRKPLGKIPIAGPPSFSPDGAAMASRWLGKIRLWDTATLQDSPTRLAEPATRTNDNIGETAFSPDWRLMATACYRHRESPVIRLWRSRPALYPRDARTWGYER
jgi:hypothetical protein